MSELNEIVGDMEITAFLLKCKQDFQFFCNNVLNDMFKDGGIQPYMMEWFDLMQQNNRVVIFAPRGFGKTTILGVAYPIWLAFTKRNLNIMIVSNSEAQSKRVLALIKSTIENSPLLQEMKPKDFKETWSSKQINTSTGCKLYCRPFTKSIKGERTDFVLMDEASSYEYPELYFDYIVPTMNPDGKIALISTSDVGSNLMALIEDRNEDNAIGYCVEKYSAIMNGESIWPSRFPMKRLNEIKIEQGEQFFEKNFMNNPFAESGQSIFTAESIRNCSDKTAGFTSEHFGGTIYLGCDFAIASGPTADFDAYTVVEEIGDMGIIKHGEVHRGLPVPGKVDRIIELVERYKVDIVIGDESHIGGEVIRQLRQEGIPTEAQSFHSRARNVLLNNLKSLLDSKKIRIPRNPEDLEAKRFTDILEKELISIHERSSKITNNTALVSTGAHDDTVMSLALAVKKIKKELIKGDYWGIA